MNRVALSLLSLLAPGCVDYHTCDLFTDVGCLDVDRIVEHVEVLASAELAGRKTGTEENTRAMAYVEEQLRHLAPPPARGDRRQVFSMPVWHLTGEPSLELGAASLDEATEFELIEYTAGGYAAGALVFVGYGVDVPAYSREDYPSCPFPEAGYHPYADFPQGGLAVAVRGQPGEDEAVDACPRATWPDTWTRKPAYASLAARIGEASLGGAAGLLVITPPGWPYEVAPAAVGAAYGAWPLPVLQLSRTRLLALVPEAQGWLDGLLADPFTPVQAAAEVTASLSVPAEIVEAHPHNVLAAVQGTGDEVVVVGAHADHLGVRRGVVYPGADDNASGVAVVLELARALRNSPTRPARTVVFAAWNGEEQGLWGSCAYVGEEPLWPLDRTVLALSLDMVGAGTPGLVVHGPGIAPGLLENAQASAEEVGLTAPIVAGSDATGSDHACFVGQGVPGALVQSTGEHPHYHLPSDGVDAVRRDVLLASAQLAWAAIRRYAAGTEQGGVFPASREVVAPGPPVCGAGEPR